LVNNIACVLTLQTARLDTGFALMAQVFELKIYSTPGGARSEACLPFAAAEIADEHAREQPNE
jgi:hypothetical protein